MVRGPRQVSIALVLAVLLYTPLLFTGLDKHGRRDWDQFTFRYETPRTALLRDHQLPFWNPYVHGGNVLLAHPNSPFPSPWYAIVLALGAPLGLRVQVVVFMIIGAIGMAALLRRWGAAPVGCFIGGIVFMMSAHFALHIAEGHLEWCVLGLMPWVVLFALKAETDWRYVVATGLLWSSVLLFGTVYIPAVFLPFLSLWVVFESIRRRSWRLAAGWSVALALMAVLSLVKLLPQLDFTSEFQRPPKPVAQGLSVSGLATVFLSPDQVRMFQATRDHDAIKQAQDRGVPNGNINSLPPEVAASIQADLRARGAADGWHEYGGYITWLGLVLAAWGIVVSWRSAWPLYGAGAVALVVTLSATSPVDLWAALQRLPLYTSLTVPSRFLAAVVFVLAIAAGFGLGWLWSRVRARTIVWRAIVGVAIPGAIVLELTVLGWRLWGDIFVYAQEPLPRHEAFAMRYGSLDTNYPGMYSDSYPLIAGHSGTLAEYENVMVPRGAVSVDRAAEYRGEVYLLGSSAKPILRRWTMAAITVDVAVTAPDVLVVNQNYWRGWQARIVGSSGVRHEVAKPREGLVSVTVHEGDREVTVFYWPDRFTAGAWISGLGWAGCVLALLALRRSGRRAA